MKHTITAMCDKPQSRNLRPAWLLLISFLLLPFSFCLAQDVRADLPANNSLRIENRRGGVNVEVWDEQHVSVSVTFEGETPKRSPVIIRRTEQLLNVLVASGATAAASSLRVNLALRIPARSRVEIITNSGEVLMRGLPETLTAQTFSGDIRLMLPDESNADVTAESTSGKVTSEFTQIDRTSGSKIFRTRFGNGRTPVRLRSHSGQIALAPLVAISEPVVARETSEPSETSTQEGRRPPTLIGSTTGQQAAGTPAPPSTGEPQEVDDGEVIRVDTELVTLNVSVVDRSTSRGLTGLAQSDFKIYEDGSEQQINHFEAANAPFNLVLLIDLSGSTADKLKLIRAAAQRFVDAARPADSIAVIAFAGAPVVVSRLTNDREALRQRIRSMETAPGDTKLYDSLNFAMNEALKDSGGSRRTAVIVMSDGLDGTLPSVRGDGSAMSYGEILSQVREFDGVLYALWVDTEYESLSEHDTQPEDFDAGHDRMAELAEAGGGLFYEVEKLEDLAGAYERVVADIGTVYSLSYRPANTLRDGKWRAIRVAVSRPNAVARGKRGYHAR
jgi:Ca-activated chloride channel family protein